ncbi:hypothetical protein ACWEV4_34935 [Streptomyces sp. NPDC003860]
MARTSHPPRDGVVVLLVGVFALTAELVAFAVPSSVRPHVGMVAAGVVALGSLAWWAVVLHRRRTAEHDRLRTVDDRGGAWFSPRFLEGFPEAELTRAGRLTGVDAARVEEAWVLARRGYGVAWLTSRLGVSHETAEVLVRSARQRSPTADG